jgi:hypothetical protein
VSWPEQLDGHGVGIVQLQKLPAFVVEALDAQRQSLLSRLSFLLM